MSERNFHKIDGRLYTVPASESEDFNAQQKQGVDNLAVETANSGRETLPGELFKTPEERWLIEKFNDYLQAECRAAGVNDHRANFPTRKIHFLLPSGYVKNVGAMSEGTTAHYSPNLDSMCVKKDSTVPPLNIAKSLLHELVHAFSYVRYDIDFVNETGSGKLGYFAADNFKGLTEGITDMITKEILLKHQAEINEKLPFTEADLQQVTFYKYCPPVEWVMNKIAEKQNVSREEVWQKFKAGLLNGQMMHLREIEKTLGAKTLRLVANMGKSKEDDRAFVAFMEEFDKNKNHPE